MKPEVANKLKDSLMEMYDRGRNDTIDIIVVLLECESKKENINMGEIIETVKSFKRDHSNPSQH